MDKNFSDDLLRGGERIRDFIDPEMDMQLAYRRMRDGIIPAIKECGEWISFKSAIEQHYRERLVEAMAKQTPLMARIQIG